MGNRIFRVVLIFFALTLLGGCGSKKPIVHRPVQETESPKKIAVFFDGTASNEGSHTNISKLYNLVTLRKNANINAAYLEGVGNGADFLGILTGSGIRKEVCNAYLYLAENYDYRRGDEIYLFGFSRGAYTARILAGLIHSAGIVDLRAIPPKERSAFIKKIYKAHKGEKTLQDRRNDVFKVTQQRLDFDSYKIEFMGLWDTVESLGLPDYNDEYYVPKNGYLDQLCNVKRAAQALSLNDNRSSVFTPVLLNLEHLVKECSAVDPAEVANEVWFFGAHSDVGGGALNTNISGVSLNWMIAQIKEYDLIPEYAEVYENHLDVTNDPRKGFMKVIFPKKGRKLVFFTSMEGYKQEKLKIHQSVLDRLEGSLQTYEINLIKLFGECFQQNDKGGYDYLPESNCFTVVN
ncbi:MAG: phospholipase effector Tle1 domain-containing protein [Aurantibacter sp.]